MWAKTALSALLLMPMGVQSAQLFPRSAAELSAGVQPIDYRYQPGWIDRYAFNSEPGATDMTDAVQAALAQQAAGGAKVIIRGNVRVTSRLDVTFAGDFIIEGTEGAVLTSAVPDAGIHEAVLQLFGAPDSRIALRGFRMDHKGTGSTLSCLDIPVKVGRVEVNDIAITGCRYYGAEINATYQVHKDSSYSHNIHGGLLVYGGFWELVGLQAASNGNGRNNAEGYGLELSGTGGIVRGGYFLDNDRYGIDARHANNFVIDGAYVYNSGLYGIYGVNEDSTKDFSNARITNTEVDMNNRPGSSHAIWVGAFGASQTSSPGEIDISGNSIRRVRAPAPGAGYGILVSSGAGLLPPTRVTVCGNRVEDIGGDHAINVSGIPDVPEVSICRNQLRNAKEIVVVHARTTMIEGNEFDYRGALERLIAVNADDVTVRDNIALGAIKGRNGVEVTAKTKDVSHNVLGSGRRACIGAHTIERCPR